MIRHIILSLTIVGCFPGSAWADSISPMTMIVESRPAVGEPQVRVTIINTTGKELDISGTAPRDIVTLIVHDSAGNLEQSTDVLIHSHSIDIMVPLRLKPEQSFIVGSNEPEFNQGWLSLTEWGYSGLPKGVYTVSARPGGLLGGRPDALPYSDAEAKITPAARANSVSLSI